MDTEHSLRSAGSSCREALDTLVCRSAEQSLPWPPELMARFNLWADEAGLFAVGKHSFDYQVRNNTKLRVMAQQFLDAICAEAEMCMRPN